MKKIFIVWKKEILDTLRDRRTLLAMVVGPIIIIPLIMIVPAKLMEEEFKKQEEKKIIVSIKGQDNLPGLAGFLKATGKIKLKSSKDINKDLREEKIHIGLIIPEEDSEKIDKHKPVDIEMRADLSKGFSPTAVAKVALFLEAYKKLLAQNALKRHKVDPAILEPINIVQKNVAKSEEMGGMLLSFLIPLFLAIGATIGGMYTAIDVTAGEKERGTLEALLSIPAQRSQLVIGKLLATLTTSLLTTILLLVSLFITFQFAPEGFFVSDGKYQGAPAPEVISEFLMTPATIFLLLLLAVPMVVTICSLEMAICLFAKSFKEAQNYLAPLQFIVILPVLPFAMIPDLHPPVWGKLIPVFGTVLAFRDVIKGTVVWGNIAATFLSSVVFAFICIVVATKLFQNERVLVRWAGFSLSRSMV